MSDYKSKLESLLEEIKQMGIHDKKVINAMREVPRHYFTGDSDIESSYRNYPLPIGKGQTISQPYTVAFMIEQLELESGDKVLEVGSGSGYNAAIMAKIVEPDGKIYSIEVRKELIDFAKKNLLKANIDNVELIYRDGSKGHEKHAPYDKIIVTAAAPEIPKALKNQLKQGGILIAPVGGGFGQEMVKLVKHKDKFTKQKLGGFRFVPLKTTE